MNEKECRDKLFSEIMCEFINNSYVSQGYLGKKIKMSAINVVDLYTVFEANKDKFEKVKSFDNVNYIGKINYIFKVLETLAEKL